MAEANAEIETVQGGPEASTPARVPIPQLVRYFLRLGALGFGGPVALCGLMEQQLVAQKGWLTKREMRDAIAVGQTLPGPLAIQVGIFAAYMRGGFWGAWAGGWSFILPNFVIVTTLAALYAHVGHLTWMTAVFYGASPVIIALIIHSCSRLAKLGMEHWLQWLIAAAAFIITVTLNAEIALVFIGAGVLGLAYYGSLFRRAKAPLALAIGLPQAAGTVAPQAPTLSLVGKLFLFFLKAGSLTFGSGLVIVPFLEKGVVQEAGWLTPRDFLIAVAIGMLSPGPVVITATFVGFLVAGFWGAAAATIGIFLPSFVLILVVAPILVRHRNNPDVQGFLKGVYGAAIGTILGACVLLAKIAVGDVFTAAMVLIAVVLLFRFKVSYPLLVGGAAILGLVAYPIFQPHWVMVR